MSAPLARLLTLVLVVCTGLAALPAAASAGQFKRDKASDVKARGLGGPQRKAIDIIGVDITKSRYLAKIVVRFRGNFERQMRSRQLKSAAALVRLSYKNGPKTTVASVGAGKRVNTLDSGRGGPFAVQRNGRELIFWIAGINAYDLAKVEVHSFRGKKPAKASAAADPDDVKLRKLLKQAEADSMVAGVVPSTLRVFVDCRRIKFMRDIVKDQIPDLDEDEPPDDRTLEEWKQEAEELTELVARVDKFLAGPPCHEETPTDGGGNTGGGNTGGGNTGGGNTGGGGGNQAPSASFTFSPTNNPPTAPRAGSSVSFVGTASDADGQVASWRWDFGDGLSVTGTGPAPGTSHTYASAGAYDARLTVFDDKGGSFTTPTQQVLVSGPGSKSPPTATGLDCDNAVTGIFFDVYIPSWAQPPFNFTMSDPVCPGRTQTVSGQLVADPAPMSEPNDAHGQRPQVYRITVTFTGGSTPGGSTGTASFSVSWN